jgi:predicted RNase H-like HicB family nuclease
MRKSGRQRWQRSQRIPGFVRKISEPTSYYEIDSAYQSLSLMQRYGTAAFLGTNRCHGSVEKVVLYRNQPEGWVAEIPAISGCYALMSTREAALAELEQVFEMVASEYRDKGLSLPADTTAVVHA